MTSPDGAKYRVSSVEMWPKANYALVDKKATGCVFRKGEYFIIAEDDSVCVMIESTSGPVACSFNSVQFIKANDGNTCISTDQMKDGGVHVDLESMKLHINEYTFNLCNHNGMSCLKMSRTEDGDFCVPNSSRGDDVKSGDQVNINK